MIKKFIIITILFFSIMTCANAAINVTENDVAIGGYDPVAYFTQNMAIKGNPEFRLKTEEGIFWLFESEEHRKAFLGDESKYTPQYGGYCAFAMGYRVKASADPLYFSIYEGKLYLNQNDRIQKKWLAKQDALIPLANQYWPNFR